MKLKQQEKVAKLTEMSEVHINTKSDLDHKTFMIILTLLWSWNSIMIAKTVSTEGGGDVAIYVFDITKLATKLGLKVCYLKLECYDNIPLTQVWL